MLHKVRLDSGLEEILRNKSLLCSANMWWQDILSEFKILALQMTALSQTPLCKMRVSPGVFKPLVCFHLLFSFYIFSQAISSDISCVFIRVFHKLKAIVNNFHQITIATVGVSIEWCQEHEKDQICGKLWLWSLVYICLMSNKIMIFSLITCEN